MAKFFQQI